MFCFLFCVPESMSPRQSSLQNTGLRSRRFQKQTTRRSFGSYPQRFVFVLRLKRAVYHVIPTLSLQRKLSTIFVAWNRLVIASPNLQSISRPTKLTCVWHMQNCRIRLKIYTVGPTLAAAAIRKNKSYLTRNLFRCTPSVNNEAQAHICLSTCKHIHRPRIKLHTDGLTLAAKTITKKKIESALELQSKVVDMFINPLSCLNQCCSQFGVELCTEWASMHWLLNENQSKRTTVFPFLFRWFSAILS